MGVVRPYEYICSVDQRYHFIFMDYLNSVFCFKHEKVAAGGVKKQKFLLSVLHYQESAIYFYFTMLYDTVTYYVLPS